ncbi:MAG: hypothetical protein KatS3mg052_2770 [Candidatus Roseilinea sp.]|nr:MAG: hypothetical protein KatS3mg052_2770 [Candidatus Roseilinea sp.]
MRMSAPVNAGCGLRLEGCLTHGDILVTFPLSMRVSLYAGRRVAWLRFHAESGEFIPQKDWDQYENCAQCHGRAEIDETPEGDLICHLCRAMLPRPAT